MERPRRFEAPADPGGSGGAAAGKAPAAPRVPWEGVFTALVTPFDPDGKLDEKGLETLVQRQVEGGVHGLIPCGTTGEAPALSDEEWARVIRITVEVAGEKAWVVAGTGTNNTAVTMARTARAAEFGVDGALVITPYYNKPTPDGLVRHYRMIAEVAPTLPLMVYNAPGRTALNLTPDTMARLAEIPSVAALKEASGDLAQVWEQVCRLAGRLPVFSGEDGLNLPVFELGGAGTVSVLSNVVPDLVVEEWEAHRAGRGREARELHDRLAPLAKALFVETNPAPVKFALDRMNLPSGDVRPPLAPLRPESKTAVEEALRGLELQ